MSPKSANPNKAVLLGAGVVLLVGSTSILAYKGYFSSSPPDHRRNETRFTKFAEQAAETPWQSEAPTALAEQVKGRIERDAARFDDKRFIALKNRFQNLEQMHKQGKKSNTDYQASLVALGNEVETLEFELDPESRPNGNGGNGNGNGGNVRPEPPPNKEPAVKGPGPGSNPGFKRKRPAN
jgi:hypothetical protein